MKAVCANCNLVMRPAKTGVAVEVMAREIGSYEIRYGDRFECPECRVSVVIGFAPQPVAKYFEAGYAARLASEEPVCRAYENLAHKQSEAAAK
jgi:rubredoxin